MSVVFQSIFMIAIMIGIGALLSRTFPFNEQTRAVFISVIVNVAMPSIILSSIFKVDIDENTFQKIVLVFGLSIFINLVGIGVGWLFARASKNGRQKSRELAILSGLGNTGFIGIPLCALLLGPEGALYAAIFDAGVDLIIWTVGVVLLQKEETNLFRSLKAMINIPTVAIVVGITAAYYNLKPPVAVMGGIDQFAGLAAPLAMFYIGLLLTTLRPKCVRTHRMRLWVPVSVKLILLPLFMLGLVGFMNLSSLVSQTVLVQSMMPTLTLASILFAKCAADEELGTMATVLSTILSLMSIPLMFYVTSLAGVF